MKAVKTSAVVTAFVAFASAAFAADVPRVPVKATGQSVDGTWTTTANIDVRYSGWASAYGYPSFLPPLSGSGSGYQVYVPFGIQTTGAPIPNWKFDFAVRSGYVNARQNTPGLTGDVSTLTDTAISGTATYTGIAGFVPFVSLNVNAPTGKAALYGPARFARMDPDLVDVPTYGEGWNFGPVVGANIPITQELLLTASVGYTYRNVFTKEGPIDPITGGQGSVRFDPGNVTTYNLGLAYAAGQLSANIGVAYATETTTVQDGVPQYRAGDRVTISGGIGYAWNDAWRTNLAGYWTSSRRNEVFVGAVNALLLEAFNSNNVVYRINLDHTYTNGPWSIGPTASYLNRNANAYSPITFQFIPAKQRYSLGVVAGHTVSKTVSLTARVERIWTHERDLPAFGTPAINTFGWLVAGGGVINF